MVNRIEFTAKVKVKAAERAGGKCQRCGLPFEGKKIEFDHILPLELGGKSELANCQALCQPCHKIKTGKEDIPRIRKSDRQKKAALGIKKQGPELQSRGFAKTEKSQKIDKSQLPKLPPRAMFK